LLMASSTSYHNRLHGLHQFTIIFLHYSPPVNV
jgi:hypothetical protein